ncbi:MAG: sulfatase-like hydrolase/transferase [Thermoplasmatota archaeon]
MRIVLVSMDCVRSDYLGQPGFSRLIDEGFLFDTCITAASHTSTSHTTMLTGTFPFDHGVRWLVRYRVRDTMLQEHFGSKGYRTGAFIGGFPLTQGDLDRGFDVFRHDPLTEDVAEGRSHYVPAPSLVDQAIGFLEGSGRDAFVFIHMFDAHLTLRSEFDEENPPPEKDENGRYRDIERHLGRRQRRYREEIDMMGIELQRLVDSGYVDLLIVTADHGEKMQGEKDYPWVHNRRGEPVGSHFHEVELWDHQLKVPLLFWGAGIVPGSSSSMVRTVEIAPTLLEWSGHGDEASGMKGTSLASALRGSPVPSIDRAYSETFFAQMHADNLHAAEMERKFEWGWKEIDSLVSLRSPERKLICTANGEISPYHFYNLETDPFEENDLIDDPNYSEEVSRYHEELLDLLGDDPQYRYHSMKGEVKSIRNVIRKGRLKGI